MTQTRWPVPSLGIAGVGRALAPEIPLASAGTYTFSSQPTGTTLSVPFYPWTSSLPKVSSGNAVQPSSHFGDATYGTTTDGADSQAEAIFQSTLSPASNYSFGVGIRLTAHSSSADGYMFEITGNGSVFTPKLYKGAAFTTITTGSTFGSSVDGMRIVAAGTAITGLVKISGVWTLAVSATDATYTAAGFPGFWVQDLTAGSLPDFGFSQFSWGTATAGTDATVTAVPSVVNVSSPVGAVSGGSSVTAPASLVAVSAPAANNIISSVVNAPAVVVLASAPAGVVSAAGNATVSAVPAVVNVSSPAAVLNAGATVAGVPALVAASSPVGALSGGSGVTAPPSLVNVQVPRGTTSPAPAGGSSQTTTITTTFAEDYA